MTFSLAGKGSDILDGDGGSDIAIFSGDFADYAVTVEAGALTVTHTSTGDADTLYGIETLRFEDGDYAVGDDGTDTTLDSGTSVTTVSGQVTADTFNVDAVDAALTASGVATTTQQQGAGQQAAGGDDTAAIAAQQDAAEAFAAQNAALDGGSSTTTTTAAGSGTTQTAGFMQETAQEFHVSETYTSGEQHYSTVGLPNGGYLVHLAFDRFVREYGE